MPLRQCLASGGGAERIAARRSSAAWFHGFGRPAELAFGAHAVRSEWLRTSGSAEPPVVEASVWLLRVGQRKAGLFDLDDTPGAAGQVESRREG